MEDPERFSPEPARPRKGSPVPAVIAFVAGAAVAVLVWAMKDTLEESNQPQYLVLAVGLFGFAGVQLRNIGRAFYVGKRHPGLDERRKSSPVMLLVAVPLLLLLLGGSLAVFAESFDPAASMRRMVAGGALVAFSFSVLAAIVRELRR